MNETGMARSSYFPTTLRSQTPLFLAPGFSVEEKPIVVFWLVPDRSIRCACGLVRSGVFDPRLLCALSHRVAFGVCVACCGAAATPQSRESSSHGSELSLPSTAKAGGYKDKETDIQRTRVRKKKEKAEKTNKERWQERDG